MTNVEQRQFIQQHHSRLLKISSFIIKRWNIDRYNWGHIIRDKDTGIAGPRHVMNSECYWGWWKNRTQLKPRSLPLYKYAYYLYSGCKADRVYINSRWDHFSRILICIDVDAHDHQWDDVYDSEWQKLTSAFLGYVEESPRGRHLYLSIYTGAAGPAIINERLASFEKWLRSFFKFPEGVEVKGRVDNPNRQTRGGIFTAPRITTKTQLRALCNIPDVSILELPQHEPAPLPVPTQHTPPQILCINRSKTVSRNPQLDSSDALERTRAACFAVGNQLKRIPSADEVLIYYENNAAVTGDATPARLSRIESVLSWMGTIDWKPSAPAVKHQQFLSYFKDLPSGTAARYAVWLAAVYQSGLNTDRESRRFLLSTSRDGIIKLSAVMKEAGVIDFTLYPRDCSSAYKYCVSHNLVTCVDDYYTTKPGYKGKSRSLLINLEPYRWRVLRGVAAVWNTLGGNPSPGLAALMQRFHGEYYSKKSPVPTQHTPPQILCINTDVVSSPELLEVVVVGDGETVENPPLDTS